MEHRMKKTTLALAVTGAVLAQQVSAAGFIEDSKAKLDLRNFYYDRNDKNTANSNNEQSEWGQGFVFTYQSGFTQGTVGVGLDLIGLYGLRLDSGGDASTPRTRSPGALFPLESDGSAVDDYSKAGATAKFRLSKNELRIGTLTPKLPVVQTNDGRLLTQLFDGGQITSTEIQGLTLVGGKLEHTKTRSSTDDIGLRIGGTAAAINSNKFYYAGGDYKLSDALTLQYYYGNLDEFYTQHFLGLVHNLALPVGSLKSDLRYFDSSSDGKNGNAAGRNEGYKSNGYWAAGDASNGEVDNRTWSALFTYGLSGHAVSLGYQQLSGNSDFPYLKLPAGGSHRCGQR
jgi:hypothetical protein